MTTWIGHLCLFLAFNYIFLYYNKKTISLMQEKDTEHVQKKKKYIEKLFITHLTTVCCCLSLPVVVAVAISCCLGRGSGCKIQLVGHEESLWWLFLLGSVDSSLAAIGLSADAPSYCQHKQAPNFHVWKVFSLTFYNFVIVIILISWMLITICNFCAYVYNFYRKVIVL